MQLTTFALEGALSDLVAASGIFDPTKLFLGVATAIDDLGVNTVLADVTPAPGTLAPLQEITTWGPVYASKAGLETVDAAVKTFSPTTSADTAVITYWYLTDASTAGNLIGFELLPVAANLLGPKSILSIVVRLTVDPAGVWSVTVSWDA